jgi:hypothetical protein
MMYDFKTQKWIEWINEPGAIGFPNWSHDGNYLYFDTTVQQQSTFRRVKVGKTNSELLFGLQGLTRYSAPQLLDGAVSLPTDQRCLLAT